MPSAIPKVVPPLPRPNEKARHLPLATAFDWLRAGWRDLWTNPLPSLIYGLIVALVSALVVWTLFRFSLDYILFPALSGFMVIGPLVATGLYEKSRRLEEGRSITLGEMLFVRPESGYQGFFLGLILLTLLMLWMRAAVILYALHFGLAPFPGIDHIAPEIFTTWRGWSLLLVGSVVGGLFAAFAFAVSVFAVPMLLEERIDALTAMGLSLALVWNNLAAMLVWGAIVAVLFAISVLTGFLALVLVFPLLGHATWHSYRAIRTTRGERVFFRPE